jgi:hypothetical protein
VYPWSSYYVRQQWDWFITRVHIVRCAWAPVATSHHTRHLRPPLPEAPWLQCLSAAESPRACLVRGSGLSLDRGGRRDSQTCGEILPTHAHRMVEKCKHGLLLGLLLGGPSSSHFNLEWWGSGMGSMFSSRLPLEGTGRIQNFGP